MNQWSLSSSTLLYFVRQMLNAVLQKRKVTYANYVAGKQ